MTPARFREIRDMACLTSRLLAGILRMDDRRLRRMAAGDEEIPRDIAEWLESLAVVMAAAPDQRKKPGRRSTASEDWTPFR